MNRRQTPYKNENEAANREGGTPREMKKMGLDAFQS